MKIYILSDESWFGGASIANHRIMKGFEDKGHDVELKIINETENTWNADFSADLYVLANWAFIEKEQLETLFKTKKVVKFFHDIPGYMYQPKTIKYNEYYKFIQFMTDNALLNVFISPMQLEIYQRFTVIKQENSMILPPPKDMSSFININKVEDRIHDVLYLGDISKARGIYESIDICKKNDWNIHFVGPWVDKELVKELQDNNFKVDKEIDNDKVAGLMNQYKYFIYVPNLIDSFCFKVVEAELCGCELLVDHYRIGRFSYNHSPEDLKDMISNSHIQLANKVEELLKVEDDSTE